MKRIYLDHAATSPLVDKAREEMIRVMEEVHGNPSSAHAEGRKARSELERFRAEIGALLGASPNEVIFTSGATEADNLALTASRGPLITSRAEHKAILEPAVASGGDVFFLDPDRYGKIALPDDCFDRPNTGLVSLMWVNNETGIIADIHALAKKAKSHGWLFHTDAVQALVFKQICFDESACDLMSLSAHKIGGPRGIGILLKKPGISIRPVSLGGGQERGLRPGTENLVGVAGLYGALKVLREEQGTTGLLGDLGDKFESMLSKALGPQARRNTTDDPQGRAPHILNYTFFDKNGNPLDSEILLHQLDRLGIACSTGSACTSGAIEPSHVLTAMGLPRDEAAASLRFSFALSNTNTDAKHATDVISSLLNN